MHVQFFYAVFFVLFLYFAILPTERELDSIVEIFKNRNMKAIQKSFYVIMFGLAIVINLNYACRLFFVVWTQKDVLSCTECELNVNVLRVVAQDDSQDDNDLEVRENIEQYLICDTNEKDSLNALKECVHTNRLRREPAQYKSLQAQVVECNPTCEIKYHVVTPYCFDFSCE